MKNITGRIVVILFAGMAAISALTLNSCKQATTTQMDTVYVNTPDWDDSAGWVYHQAGNSGLVISQFTDGLNFPAAEWNVGGENGMVIRSMDTGKDWSAVNSVPGGGTIYGIWFFDQNKGIAVGDGQSVWQTNDGGASWNGTPINTGFRLRALYFVNKSTGFIGTADWTQNPLPGQNGEIWKTTDGGQTWSNVYTISGTGSVYGFQFTSQTDGIATGKYGLVLVTHDGGNTWTPGNSGVSGNITHSAFVGSNTIYSVCLSNSYSWPADTVGGTIIKTTDGGMNWQSVQSTPYGLTGIATNHNGVITAAGFGGNILESTDNGATWTHSTFGSDRWIDINYAAPYRAVMIGTNGHLVTRDR